MKKSLIFIFVMIFISVTFVLAGECNDSIDNDGDGQIDYPTDTGCTSGLDTNEKNIIFVDNSASAKTTCNQGNLTYNNATRTCGTGYYKIYTTIQGAADVTQAGYSVYVREGIYSGFAIMNKVGTANEKIIFQPYQGESVIVDSYLNIPKPNVGWRYGWEHAVLIYGNSRYIEISGFVITDSNPLYDSDYYNDYSQGKGNVGIILEWITRGGVADAPSYIKIFNNTIHHIGSSCIMDFPEVLNIEIIGNDIYDCGLSKRGYGMYINGDNYLIKGNKIHHGYGGGIHLTNNHNVTIDPDGGKRYFVEDNFIYEHGHDDYGLGYSDINTHLRGNGIYCGSEGEGMHDVHLKNNVICDILHPLKVFCFAKNPHFVRRMASYELV